MSEQDNSGPAFPVPRDAEWGMSLRDWLAGQAISAADSRVDRLSEREMGILFGSQNNIGRQQVIARVAYTIADAMLAERKKSESR